MNKVIDKGFRCCRFVSTIVKHPVVVRYSNKLHHTSLRIYQLVVVLTFGTLFILQH